MTREQLNARPVALTAEQCEQVTGGSAANVFVDANVFVKETGSIVQGNSNGTVNVHFHEAT